MKETGEPVSFALSSFVLEVEFGHFIVFGAVVVSQSYIYCV